MAVLSSILSAADVAQATTSLLSAIETGDDDLVCGTQSATATGHAPWPRGAVDHPHVGVRIRKVWMTVTVQFSTIRRVGRSRTKGSSGRLRSFRDSVKRLTKSLSDGEGSRDTQNDEHARRSKSFAPNPVDGRRKFGGSTSHATSSNKRRSKTKSSSPLSRSQITNRNAAGRGRKTDGSPSTYGFSSLDTDGTGNVYVSGRKMKVSLHPTPSKRRTCVKGRSHSQRSLERHRGAWVRRTGEVVRLKDVLEGNRALVTCTSTKRRSPNSASRCSTNGSAWGSSVIRCALGLRD